MKQNQFARATLLIGITLISFITMSAFIFQQKEWTAPAAEAAKKSTVANDAATIADGKILYTKQCKSCHGKGGKGDGPSAAQIDIPVGDFTSDATQSESDGTLFWKVHEGRKSMPSFKKKMDETEIWQVVAYMRTLKK
jgi:mono/diheme cytochrome c family protein